MKILLLKDIQKLGRKGDIVDVSSGYAKNALLPQHLAQFADEQTIKQWKAAREREQKEQESKIAAIQSLLPKLRSHVFQFHIPVGKNGEIFSSLHEETIRAAVANFCAREEKSIGFDDIDVRIKPIKQLGEATVKAKIGTGNGAADIAIRIEVLPEADLNR